LSVEVNTDTRLFPALLNLLNNRSYHVARFISTSYNDRLIELLHRKKFDLVLLEGLYLSPYLETIRTFSEAKIAMRAHNVEHEIWEGIASREKHFFRKKYLQWLAKQLRSYEISRLNKYDCLIPISDKDAEKIKSFGCEIPVFTSPASYDETVLIPDKQKTEYPSLFFIGALDWMPNAEGLKWFLRQVFPAVQLSFPEIKFYIAGRKMQEAKDILSAVHALKNVFVLGEIDDAYSFMNSKAVMVVPLFSGSGMRVKIIEGMALGKTIVTTSLGAEGIPCKDGQNILIADSAPAFAEKIKKCLGDKLFFSVIGDNALNFAKNRYRSVEVGSQLLEFFKQIVRT